MCKDSRGLRFVVWIRALKTLGCVTVGLTQLGHYTDFPEQIAPLPTAASESLVA
jgi:hypothetical protein